MATFPHSLCGIRQDGHGEQHAPMVLRSDMERGIPKQRRAGADVLVRVPCSLVFRSAADAAAFEAWFYADGMGWFDFTLPRTGAVVQARIIGGDIGTLSPLTPAWNASERSVVLEYVRPAFVTLAPGLHTVDASRILSVQRNSTATYIDDAGVLQTAAANVARWQGGLLLVEGEATNLHLQSDTLTPSWVLSACTAAASAVLGPDPSKNMRLLVPSTAVSQHIAYRQPALVAGVTYTHSVYAKADALDRVCLWASATGGALDSAVGASFNVASGTVNGVTGSPLAEIEHVGGGIYRCSIKVTAVANALGTIGFSNHPVGNSTGYPVGYAGDGVSGVLIVGAQLEPGNLSSYIPTTTAAVTRAADIITVAA